MPAHVSATRAREPLEPEEFGEVGAGFAQGCLRWPRRRGVLDPGGAHESSLPPPLRWQLEDKSPARRTLLPPDAIGRRESRPLPAQAHQPQTQMAQSQEL